MPESEAKLGYGSNFQILDESVSPPVFTELGEVFNITPPSSEVDQVDVTHMQSPGRRREFIDGLIDPGECSFEMNYVPGSVADQTLLAILNTPLNEERKRTCRIIYPNGAKDTFSGNLMTYQPAVPTDDKMTASVSFRVTGEVARTAAAAPANVLLPAISGIAQQGQTLTAYPGEWTGAPAFTYQWYTASASPPAAIAGATGRQYTPVVGDVGHALSVQVTATNSEGSAAATSAETAAVLAA